ncbi:MAG: Ig-like domain-containing protein, partial [Methylophilaceae bacterium]|nr:Ig-like domain-containing protein [Methylophilaceae bacterium]
GAQNALTLNGVVRDQAGNSLQSLQAANVVDNHRTVAAGTRTEAPKVLQVLLSAATDNTGNDITGNPLREGDVVTVTVVMSEAVTVSASGSSLPSLLLLVGEFEDHAIYASGSTTTQLRFTYTVPSVYNDPNGISILASDYVSELNNAILGGIQLNGGSIVSTRTNRAADLTLSAVQDNRYFKIDNTNPPVPILSLVSDTGVYATDRITNNPTINVLGLESTATWQYQVDSTSGSWLSGIGTSFTANSGIHTYFVQQTDTARNVSTRGLAIYTLDTTPPSALTVALASDTGVSNTDNISNNPTINIMGLQNGNTWSYQLDQLVGWLPGIGTSFIASAGGHSYRVRQIDAAGNSTSTTVSYTIQQIAPIAPVLVLASDTGSNPADGLTNIATVNVRLLLTTASWQYQVDSSAWMTGVGSSFTMASGAHSYAVQQMDLAGNTSIINPAVSYTLDTTAPLAATMMLMSDTGASPSDHITNNPVFVLIGLESTANWTYQVDGGTWSQPVASVSGSSFMAVSGIHTYTVRHTDLAGNSTDSVATYIYYPSVVAPDLSLMSDSGLNASDGLTNNPT